jgi:transposase
MSTPPPDPKTSALRRHGSLHPHPERITDPAFAKVGFFDGRDLVQVKYEMLRRVSVERAPVSATASAFGLSRPAFYQAKAAFKRGGLPALLPRKRGPHGAHKLTPKVLQALAASLAKHPELGFRELAHLAKQRFGLKVHPRSVERALARAREKKQRPANP